MTSPVERSEAARHLRNGQAASNGRRRGVLLVNLGTPDSPDRRSVQKYLAEFLSDPSVIQLPRGLGWFNRPLGHLIASLRAKKSASLYRRIWTESGSPLCSITSEQTEALGAVLPPGWQAFYAMRYGRPSIEQALEHISEARIDELVVIPMYPQFSGTTTGTAVRELYSSLRRGGHHFSVIVRNSWFEDGGYVYAQAKLIRDYALAHGLSPENTRLVLSAHGLPVSYINRGDPYLDQIQRSIELITARLGWPAERVSMGYQSRMGPAKWVEPNLDELLLRLAREGEKRLLVCPISFTADCLETLEEIDVRYRAVVENAGADLFLSPALNTSAPFISALKELALRGPRPSTEGGSKTRPLFSSGKKKQGVARDTDALVLIGVSKANRVGDGLGPQLRYSTEAGLCKTKKAQCDIVPLLKDVCAQTEVTEAFVWNTCARFEFYGWLSKDGLNGKRDQTVAEVKRSLFGQDELEGMDVNVHFGVDAWHHLMRTVSGLNSGLPGDKDILEQLETAQRVSERAGSADSLTKRLISDAISLERDVRKQTSWGQFDPGYCYAAMARIVEATDLTLADSQCTVFGGSTTSRSVLTTLAQRFDVPTRTLTLVYRGHGSGQMKLLRKAIGNGKRVRVGAYNERAALDAAAEADVIVLGIDADKPILDVDEISDLRDFRKRPLTIIDFNTFGSTRGLETIEGVTVFNAQQLDDEVVAYGEAMCASPKFADAVGEAEEWIVTQSARRQCQVAVEPTQDHCRACGRPRSSRCLGPTLTSVGSSIS
ncbi:MAG: ferrochelatase [Phycisphaerales bacterium]|nr:MAG: ferrochelatase [Phycisphaerales bacterium]